MGSRRKRVVFGWAAAIVLAAIVAALGARELWRANADVAVAGSGSGSGNAVQAVARRDIEQVVEATGTVEPIEVVEIKSKAGGQILRMPVETGTSVRAGQLLAQIDTVDVRNQYDQAASALEAASVSARVSAAALHRSDDLAARGMVTVEAHESAQLADANARAELVRARAALEIAGQALRDATVRAPADGIIIEQDATRGQVIASVTASASGGTTLLKMADLRRVQIRALVSETDIGSVHAGTAVKVTVDAFAHRTFRGRVLKIEPRATIQQSVTLFPVLVSIDNSSGLLLPGMNGEVSIAIARRSQVLAVPVEAVRSMSELASSAAALGLASAAGVAAGSPDEAVALSTGGRIASDERQVVFVRTASGIVPRVVRLGVSDYDYAEVLDGLAQGEQVVQIGVAEVQAVRQGEQAQIRSRMGSLPGLPGKASGTSSAVAASAKPAAAGGR